jgi:hypothetical protein
MHENEIHVGALQAIDPITLLGRRDLCVNWEANDRVIGYVRSSLISPALCGSQFRSVGSRTSLERVCTAIDVR